MMKTDIIPLGTSSATPTRTRALSATALQRAGRILLFDCGEGTQFRLMEAGLSPARIDAVFITHLHGDHFFGLPGLLTTLSLNRRLDPITIAGPAELGTILQQIPGVGEHELTFPIHFVELREGFGRETMMETPDYRVVARPLDHRVFTAGYRFEEAPTPGTLDVMRARALGITDYLHFRELKAGRDVRLPDGEVVRSREVVGPQQKGSSFAYLFDTRPCPSGVELARDVDLVFHDATFLEKHHQRARHTGHSTAVEAAHIAEQAGAHRLLLGHFSARYQSVQPLVEEAQRIFKNTDAAEELKRYSLETVRRNPSEGV
ncbi:MAG: ribonuclease Z [Bacteroidota bacterium]